MTATMTTTRRNRSEVRLRIYGPRDEEARIEEAARRLEFMRLAEEIQCGE